ncbi:protein NLP1-like [Curcuma longa]|uniref:protein NLP1-like n=1 Tax=Curcuma longa TaxID=136217 RepID=UPI003D9E52D2
MEDSGVDLDLLDELLSWPDFDYSDFHPSNFLPVVPRIDDRVDAGRPVFAVQSSTQVGLVGDDFGYEPDKIWQTQHNNPMSTVKQRLNHALRFIKESHKDGDVLVQVWVPVMRGGKQVLTTCGQPFFLDFNCERLVNYRSASTRYQFLADEDSHQAVGLPGRVFLWKLPECSPDVRFFSSYEYPRVKDARQYDVRGTIALPVFEKDSQSCLGVVELVMTTQKVNYSSDIEKICNAFQAIDLRTREVFSVPHLKMTGDSYQAALSEIQMVLQTACKTHRLPLAQTWISCLQQGKKGNWHSDEQTFMDCISTDDDACYVQDPSMKDFQQACSEHHLFRGQGIVGKAFMTNQPCFSSNITDFSKIEYPLSHHAKLFNLRAAVAIRLRCVHTGNVDFVLEFFLPVDCIGSEAQKLMLSSLSITIQQVSRTLRVVATEELEDEIVSENNEKNISSATLSDKSVSEIDPKPLARASNVGIAELASCDGGTKSQEGLLKCLFAESTQGKPMKKEFERFRVTTHPSDAVIPTEKVLPEFTQLCDDSHDDYTVSFSAETSVLNMEKVTEKRRTKTEKTVNLQELQKYFAGSLKDAAKSLGVCPTTLKRICRQHGISRWPSRKIKKVGHSLKKLQVVLDSVHGPAGGIQFTSLYENFIKTTWSDKNLTVENTFSPSKQFDHPESSNVNEVVEGGFTSRTSGSNSLSSSSCSQNSSSSQGCSIEQKQCMHNAHELAFIEDTLADKKQSGILKEAQSHIELHLPTEQPPVSVARTVSQELQVDHRSSGNKSLWPLHRRDLLKVKAICGEEKVIFRLHPAWGFLDLKQEIMRRFGITDTASVDIKYLDDDSEWILITCDDDLKECIDVYKLTNAHTIKLSAHHVAQSTTRSSWGSSVLA